MTATRVVDNGFLPASKVFHRLTCIVDFVQQMLNLLGMLFVIAGRMHQLSAR